MEENVYEMMHSNHGNKRKNEEEKEQERKEEPHYGNPRTHTLTDANSANRR